MFSQRGQALNSLRSSNGGYCIADPLLNGGAFFGVTTFWSLPLPSPFPWSLPFFATPSVANTTASQLVQGCRRLVQQPVTRQLPEQVKAIESSNGRKPWISLAMRAVQTFYKACILALPLMRNTLQPVGCRSVLLEIKTPIASKSPSLRVIRRPCSQQHFLDTCNPISRGSAPASTFVRRRLLNPSKASRTRMQHMHRLSES